MPELAFAQEALNAARAFLQLDLRTQWSYRTTLSRLYYVRFAQRLLREPPAHHLGRLLLQNVGLTPHLWSRDVHFVHQRLRLMVHRRVINELEHHYVFIGVMSYDALEALEHLLRYRIQADYELTRVIQPTVFTK